MYLVSRQQSCLPPAWFLTYLISYSEFSQGRPKNSVCSCIFSLNQPKSVRLVQLIMSWAKEAVVRFWCYSSLHIYIYIYKVYGQRLILTTIACFFFYASNLKNDLRFDCCIWLSFLLSYDRTGNAHSFLPRVQFGPDHTTAADICSFSDLSRALLQNQGSVK